jgi:hypothetical protein
MGIQVALVSIPNGFDEKSRAATMGIQGRELFQFQTGSIRSPGLRLWEFREENCFNSKRVR